MPLKTNRDEQPTLNLAPMIDIIFLLLIFFIVGTRVGELSNSERDLSLSVPQVSQLEGATSPQRKRVINVFGDGHVEMDSQPMELSQLKTILSEQRGQNPALGVVVRGDGSCPYQVVAEVIAICHAAAITDLNVAVRVAQLERAP